MAVKKRIKAISFAAVGLLTMVVLSSCAIVPINAANGSTFSASHYVQSVWSSKVIPYMNSHVESISSVLIAMHKNAKQAEKKYGFQKNGSGWQFIVQGVGKVSSYDSNYGQGLTSLSLDSGNFKGTIQMQTGPIILGTSIRDALPFVQFGQFENQIQFSEVSSAFNDLVKRNVLQDYTFKHLIGKMIGFVGVLSINTGPGQMIGAGPLVLTPVELKKG